MSNVIPSEHAARRRKRRRRGVLIALSGVLVIACAVFWRPLFWGNFGVVDAGHVYRSAQPGSGLDPLIRGLKLATVLNLAGGSLDKPAYANEVRTTSGLGVDFYDFPMSATRRPSRHELLTLLDLFDRCRYPLLIHCKAGADRTGLASAFYLMARRGVDPNQAMRAFTVDYGHVPIFGPERLHEPVAEYADWLKGRNFAHTPERLRVWVETGYRSDEAPTPFRPLRPGPRESVAGGHSRVAR